MKKYLIILSAALLAATTGCMQFEHDVPVDEVYVDAPTITVNSVEDDGFTVTITPATGTGYYSYAIKQGPAEDVAAKTIFKLGLAGSMDKGTAKFADKSSMNLEYSGLDMNSDYTIYAVSSSELGCVGDVVSTSIHTTDTEKPAIEGDYEATGTKVVINFTEAVNFDAAKGLDVKYYAVNKGIEDNEPQGTVTDYNVKVSGVTATIDCGSMPDGAYYAVSIPDGAFKDAVGNSLPAVESGFGVEDGEVAGFGITGRKATKDFELSIYGGKPVTIVSNLADPIWISKPEDVEIAKFTNEAKGSIVYEYKGTGISSVTTYDVTGGYPDFAYGWNGSYDCALSYPNAGYTDRPNPERGSMITINIPKFLTDIYGNQNAEFVIGPFLYSYGFTVKDIIGTYQLTGESIFGAQYHEGAWDIVIEESDDASKGNVMVTSYYGFDGLKIYGEFDGDKGEFWMPIDYEPLGGFIDEGIYFDYYTFAYYSTQKGGEEGLTLYMTKSGEIADASDYPGYYYEAYAMPASGKLEDIDPDKDFLGYDYNEFVPDFQAVTPAETALSSIKNNYPVRMMNTGARRTFTRQIAK